MEREFLTIAEVARRLGVSASRAYALAAAGGLPVRRRGKRVLVPARAFERWLERESERALAAVAEDEDEGA